MLFMKPRVVIPELLDHLPADEPEALRSRRDLRRVNWLMGNERWLGLDGWHVMETSTWRGA